TLTPSQLPSKEPSTSPTQKPSKFPTLKPSIPPTRQPTGNPTSTPSDKPTENPTAMPTRKPTGQPIKAPSYSPTTPSPTMCEERKWHKSSQIKGCSNTNDIDPDNDMAYAGLEDCCWAEFGVKYCDSYDVCAPTISPSTTPTTLSPTRNPTTQPVVPLITPEPSPAPTRCEDNRKWRPNVDSTLCTNAADSTSNDSIEIFLDKYDSLQECCDQVFGSDGGCKYEDVCVDEITPNPTRNPITPNPTSSPITPDPTASPTWGATPTVSKETTGPPTKFSIPRVQWEGDSWGDGTSNGNENTNYSTPSSTKNKCKQAERDACCNQALSKSENAKRAVCDMLGCNIKKCGKRVDKSYP
ncbi:hypothetical protein ACHAXR_004721, partial [Thalassiosira sp. AJA248-18]